MSLPRTLSADQLSALTGGPGIGSPWRRASWAASRGASVMTSRSISLCSRGVPYAREP